MFTLRGIKSNEHIKEINENFNNLVRVVNELRSEVDTLKKENTRLKITSTNTSEDKSIPVRYIRVGTTQINTTSIPRESLFVDGDTLKLKTIDGTIIGVILA